MFEPLELQGSRELYVALQGARGPTYASADQFLDPKRYFGCWVAAARGTV